MRTWKNYLQQNIFQEIAYKSQFAQAFIKFPMNLNLYGDMTLSPQIKNIAMMLYGPCYQRLNDSMAKGSLQII